MDEQLIALYHRHIATAFDRQLRMADYLAQKTHTQEWHYDIPTATLTFGKVKFEAPILGSHASGNNSWLWAWSNKNLKLTLTNRALGDLVRVTAHRLGVSMLAANGFSIEPLLGELTEHAAHIFGIVFSRELEYDAYYTAPYDGGRSTILIRDDRLKFTESHPLHRILTVFPRVIGALPVFNHRAALDAYARDYTMTVNSIPGGLKITDGKGGELAATFDVRDRLTNLAGTGVAVPPVKKVTKVATKPALKKPKKATVKKAATKKPTKLAAKSSAPKAKAAKASATKKPAVKKTGGGLGESVGDTTDKMKSAAKKTAKPAAKAKPVVKKSGKNKKR